MRMRLVGYARRPGSSDDAEILIFKYDLVYARIGLISGRCALRQRSSMRRGYQCDQAENKFVLPIHNGAPCLLIYRGEGKHYRPC
jgi:hypothetical protein